MLDLEEFKSIWEISYRWEGLQPPDNDLSSIPDGVKKKIEKLIWAFREEQLQLRDSTGQAVYDSRNDLIDLLFLNQTRKLLRKCFKQKHYPKSIFGGLFIKRADLLKWCKEDFTNLPEFWIEDTAKPANESFQAKQLIGRHVNQDQDKQLCQSIARTLWDIDPNIHPAHMAKSWAILEYGNGRLYKNKDGEYETPKNWIKEVDPHRDSRGDGRPRKIPYLIDLENGGLAKD
ncbi:MULTISPECIES: hypothetical protein [Methylomonas]|uniref:Uncharacterized protein n=1 Tax=Methylomonas koyamae TaxID=702114 RepID=A0A177NML2_9GAMM|nr:hypothetical protein [Methylomonas koyamae]OAI18270.1 hypothetical protein A1355_05950 [Methylomonas koyamae]